MSHTLVFWLTGLSGSGKTTIVNNVVEKLSKSNKKIKVYDGDIIRKEISKHLSFNPEDIKENNRIIMGLCYQNINEGYYDYIFVPIISPFSESRDLAREYLGRNFSLIYINASLDKVIQRDVKGLYQKALVGEIQNFIGISESVPYQAPDNADLVLDTDRDDLDNCVKKFQSFIALKEKSHLPEQYTHT